MNMSNSLTAVVLAAGAGTRMRSRRSKVLHELAGRPLLHYPVLAALQAGAAQVVVVASPGNERAIRDCLSRLTDLSDQARRCDVAIQAQPRGTGDAAKAALPHVAHDQVLILNGDIPLVRGEDLLQLTNAFEAATSAPLALMSCELTEPAGYGRILRQAGRVVGVREEKDLESDAQRAIREVNAGIYLANRDFLSAALGALTSDNAQGEYYVTDIVERAAREATALGVFGTPEVMQGVNDRAQLATMEALLYQRIADGHRRAGVTIQVGALIDDTVRIGGNATVRANASLRGDTVIGNDVLIEQGVVIDDSVIGDGAVIKPYCVIVQSRVGQGAQVGPFAHMRPESELGDDARIGNFVEMKKSVLKKGAKANHLTYLGDTEVGENANVGAGTIVCNYDGFSKQRTVIGKGAFIGSDSQLIAPVRIGDGAYVGTGTTVTRDVPEQALALSRPQQIIKEDYAPKLRERLQAAARARKAGGRS